MALTASVSAVSGAASSIGGEVWRSAVSACVLRVIGVTSRGLFLLSPLRQIIFVSFERYRSPLTINLDRSFDRLRAIEVSALARFSDSRLIFPSIEISISLSVDSVWHCPLPISVSCPRIEQRHTLRMIAEGALAQSSGEGLAAMLPHLTDVPAAGALSTEHAALLERLIMLRSALQAGNCHATIAGLTSLLGQGRGLTPSGDDVVIGLLLMLNRWHTDRDWTEVNRTVIAAAYQSTTTISANLIECAADGQGDERLTTVADSIAAGLVPIDECVNCVLSWGSSSGVAALAGMAVVV